MKIIDPYVCIAPGELSTDKIRQLERYGRVCYKSEARITADSARKFIKGLINNGHESVIEHEKATVLMVTDRGVSHEIVRHRIGSYSQESTRYCNYASNKFGAEITVIRPFFYGQGREQEYREWELSCKYAERVYLSLIANGQAQEARSVLPNSLKTEIVVTYNLREWRHFFKLRCSSRSHPQMRQIAIPLLLTFRDALPGIFDDIDYDISFPADEYAKIILKDEFFSQC